ncbi:hypothetical protein PLANPX_1732 [Lacipirellula parvula]|uniref:Uncharacterized protein n=1 Tax=Lacipirellula parvula TaxID=2650471 RepID=A0A5K7X6C2_9BACT|nr:hypothetical protein PLANPX_1732 [Lacipirellula parvula]
MRRFVARTVAGRFRSEIRGEERVSNVVVKSRKSYIRHGICHSVNLPHGGDAAHGGAREFMSREVFAARLAGCGKIDD